MTKEEVIAAGIDLGDEENFNSFKYSIEADFKAGGVVIERVVARTPGRTYGSNAVITFGGGETVVITNKTQGYSFETELVISDRQKDMLLAGGLLNYTKENA